MMMTRRSILLAALLGAGLLGCDQSNSSKPLAPVEIDARTTCDLDGMLLADYPGPKAQIHYAGQEAPIFFCDTVEMFHTLLAPEQVKAIRAVYVQDMGKADWEQPRGNW
ncbi:nitrous oxide reductase accessory protein NosL, partial [Rhodoferax sp. UBA5149]|uniref:nitrous oxide reductase accessory protein NosL n=1 Tax=Rhodoferax sp. UBA5149 TaxID=1947379 RepID=UPI0025E5AFAC